MSLNEKLAELEELHRMQLVAISVAAGCNTPESSEKQSIGRDNPYWSAAYSDVRAAVDREIKLLAQLAAYQAELSEEPATWIVDFERHIVRHPFDDSMGDYVIALDYYALRAHAQFLQAKIDAALAAYAGLKVENERLKESIARMMTETQRILDKYDEMEDRAEAAESTVAELRAKLAEVMQSAPAAREAGDE